MTGKEVMREVWQVVKDMTYSSRYILIALGTLILCAVVFHYTLKDYNYDVYRNSNELHLQAAKCAIVDEVDKYIHTIAPNSCLNALPLVEACEEYDVDIIFVLAQGQIESHYGTKGVAAKTNSVFNVYSYDGVSADEINKAGRGYKHPDFSVEPYLKLLKTRYLVDKTERDMFHKFVDIDGRRYASAADYEKKLMNTYISIDSTTSLNILYEEYRKYKLITYK